MKSCFYFSLLSSVIFIGTAFAACTPSPDCTSLGYTATSCPNGGVKCPFDTSKWHCDKGSEDFGYIYLCMGTGYMGGIGNPYNGKYALCTCSLGYEWKDGRCQKRITYEYNCCRSDCYSYSSCQKVNYGETCDTYAKRCQDEGGIVKDIGCNYASWYQNVLNFARYKCVF